MALLSASGASGIPTLVANGTPYANTSKPNATGRSGAASITARALIGKDGWTQLEVTTGALDGGASPGNLAQVQVKALGPNDDPVFTLNYNRASSTGYWTTSYEGLARGTTLQVQTNVRGIDRNRTGVITVREMIKLRPDIVVSNLTNPAKAKRGQTVNIDATILETNGDVGAYTECVLYVNGTAVERIPSVWVNAGGSVACAFMRTFTSVGRYALAVAAENVVPGDYDKSNNSASGSIEIVNPTTPLHGFAEAISYRHDDKLALGWRNDYPTVASYYEVRIIGQSSRAHGFQPFAGGGPIGVEVTITSGASTLGSLNVQGAGDSGWGCVFLWQNFTSAVVCPSYGYYSVGHRAIDVVYFSGWYTTYWNGTGYVHTAPLRQGQRALGNLAAWGPTVAFDIKLSVGGQDFSAAPVVSLQPFARSWSNPYACRLGGHQCWGSEGTSSFVWGWSVF